MKERFSSTMEKDLLISLKVYCAQNSTTMSQVIEDALTDYLKCDNKQMSNDTIDDIDKSLINSPLIKKKQ